MGRKKKPDPSSDQDLSRWIDLKLICFLRRYYDVSDKLALNEYINLVLRDMSECERFSEHDMSVILHAVRYIQNRSSRKTTSRMFIQRPRFCSYIVLNTVN